MFRGLINDAKSAVGELAARYATRAVIGVLFVFALGFATAAITVQLISAFGSIAAYWMVAGAFAVFGLIALAAENWRETAEAVPPQQSAADETAKDAVGVTSEAALQLPIALLGTFLTSSSGPLSLLGVVRFLGRNITLVLLTAIIAILLWPTSKPTSKDAAAGADPASPDTDASPPATMPEPAANAARAA